MTIAERIIHRRTGESAPFEIVGKWLAKEKIYGINGWKLQTAQLPSTYLILIYSPVLGQMEITNGLCNDECGCSIIQFTDFGYT